MADYAEPLKRVWKRIVCNPTCPVQGSNSEFYCPGHAALLEMVGGYHLPNCECHLDCKRDDRDCLEERRRLRAAVEVEEGKS